MERYNLCVKMLESRNVTIEDIAKVVYFLQKDVPIEKLVMQEGETCGAMWVNRAAFEQMIRQKKIAAPDVKSYQELKEKLSDLLK